MAFAGHCGVSLNLDTLCYDPLMNDADGLERKPEMVAGRFRDRLMGALFAEELGALVQIRRDDRSKVMQVLRAHGLAACSHTVGELNTADEIRVWRNAKPLLKEKRVDLQRAWSETATRSPACATTRNAPRRSSIPCSMRPTPACRRH
jgi:phosphoribosylformylglycinamidine synthase